MKLHRIAGILGWVLAGGAAAFAQMPGDTELLGLRHSAQAQARTDPDSALKLDPKRIINESKSLLKEREPEMTAEEYALYEKIVLMLGSQPAFAIKLLETMTADKQAPSPAFEFMLGNAYYSAQQMDKAAVHFRAAVTRYPSFIRAWDNLGVLYYTTEKYQEAIPCFSRAVALGDHEPTTVGLLGYCLERTGNVVAAEVSYLQALAGNPDNADWMEGLLRVYVQGRQYGRAESLVKSLLKLQPGEARFWLTYAGILLAENRKLDATVVLEAAVGAGVAGPNELNQLGDLYAEQGLHAEAAAIYERITKDTPGAGEQKLLHLAQVLITLNRLTAAEQVLARLPANVSPAGRPVLLQARADILAARKQWPEARRQLEELLRVEPLNGPALLALGRAHLAENDLIRAAFAFESAVQVPATAYSASLELANVEFRNRHYDRCVEYLQKALKIERTDAVEDFLARVRSLLVSTEGSP